MILMNDFLIYLKDGSDVCIQGGTIGQHTKRSVIVNGAKLLFGADIIDIQVFDNEESPI